MEIAPAARVRILDAAALCSVHRQRDGSRRAGRSEHARLERRLERALGGGDRRLGAVVILLCVFGALPSVLMPLAVAVAAILNTFTLV